MIALIRAKPKNVLCSFFSALGSTFVRLSNFFGGLYHKQVAGEDRDFNRGGRCRIFFYALSFGIDSIEIEDILGDFCK